MSEEKANYEKKTRTRRPKDQAKSVTLNLDDETREQLLALNAEQARLADCEVPLTATLKRAIRIASEALQARSAARTHRPAESTVAKGRPEPENLSSSEPDKPRSPIPPRYG